MSEAAAPLKLYVGRGKRYIPGFVHVDLVGLHLTNALLECGVDVHVLVRPCRHAHEEGA